jgi:hypothetical protein
MLQRNAPYTGCGIPVPGRPKEAAIAVVSPVRCIDDRGQTREERSGKMPREFVAMGKNISSGERPIIIMNYEVQVWNSLLARNVLRNILTPDLMGWNW